MWSAHPVVVLSAGDVRSAQVLFPVLQKWMDDHPGLFSLTPPDASAVAFIRYDLQINSTELIRRLVAEKDVDVGELPGIGQPSER